MIKVPLHLWRAAQAALFILLATATNAAATERWLVPDTSQCAPNTTTNPCYTTLADAVTNSVAGDSIRILPSATPYPAGVTLTKNITIFGVETARTFLTGNGSAAVTVSGVTTSMDIKNLTFIDASPGILVNNASTQVNIVNNVFEVGSASTAVQVSDASSSPVIVNNTFYQNGTAIVSTPNTLSIANNIFSGNVQAISSNVVIDNIFNNLFDPSSAAGPAGIIFNGSTSDPNFKGNLGDKDPLFVDALNADVTKRDFHLKSGTPCEKAGTASFSAGANSINGASPPDIGTYGGSKSDTIPFPVAVSPLVVTGTSPFTITVSWTLNTCYLIGGYTVSYGTASKNYTTTLTVNDPAQSSLDITSLVPSNTAPSGKPALLDTFSGNTITLFWNALNVSGATGFEIRYDTTSPIPVPPASPGTAQTFDVDGATSSFTLSNLQNETTYYFLVTPFSQDFFFIAVRAFYAANPSFLSAFSNEVSTVIGDKRYGTPSDEIHDFPEAIVAYPNLPRKGCFIATAAYGGVDAPAVRALRDFRDRYLLMNAPGRAFVRWYYEHSPAAVKIINDHPWLKPVVRTALAPAVGVAMLMTETNGPQKFLVLLVLFFIAVWLMYRKKLGLPGDRR